MGTEKDSVYYNQMYEHKKHKLQVEESGYFELYQKALTLMPINKTINILEIGCGSGMFAELLQKNNYHNYLGIDFSEKAISLALNKIPNMKFEVQNLFQLSNKFLQSFDTFIMLEVLEHINRDLEFLNRLPKESTIIISLPNTDYESHVRHFKNETSIIKRYNSVLNFEDVTFHNIINQKKKNKQIFLFKTIKKGD